MSEWISVEDGNPDKTGEYRIKANGFIEMTARFNRRLLRKKIKWLPFIAYDYWGAEAYGGYKVTHWMPLPESPKEGE